MAAVLTTTCVTLAVAVFSRIFADEFKAWSPWITARLIDIAVLGLPDDLQERYREEWSSHVADIPGEIGKLFASLGFSCAANRIYANNLKDNPAALPSSVEAVSYEGRTRFGLLPEPEINPASFLTSCIINGAILVVLIVFGTVANHELQVHKLSQKEIEVNSFVSLPFLKKTGLDSTPLKSLTPPQQTH